VAWDIISKQTGSNRLGPNLRDYAAVRAAFSWEAVRAELAIPGDLNIAYHALDRHIVEGRGDEAALRCLGKNDKDEISHLW
jgi:acetyl-CoA synthetase